MDQLKRYLLFYGDNYYPFGGWEDFKGSFATPDEAMVGLRSSGDWSDWYHIVDSETGRIVQKD